MKSYIENILPRIAKFSEQLDKLSLLLDEPWVVVNGDEGFVKLIFRKDNSILVSKNGEVSIGKWELLNKANSMLIQIESSSKLYNHCFLDAAVMILILDGGSQFLTLANQNRVPNLDLEKYLKEKIRVSPEPQISHSSKGERTISSRSGNLVITYLYRENMPTKGDKVSLNGRTAPNGKYKIDSMFYIHVRYGEIVDTSMF